MEEPPLTNIQALLFDFDGTLAPNLDLPEMRRQVVALTASLGVPGPVYEGRYIVEVIDAACAWLRRTKPNLAQRYYTDAHQLILDIELGAAAQTQPFDGVRQYLADLRHDGFRSGVVTRNCRAAVLQTFPDLLQWVDVLHARDDVTHIKPDFRHLTATLRPLQVAPQHAAMIGDGGLDMVSGRQAGMYCVGVLSGSADAELLAAKGAHVIHPSCLDFDPRRAGLPQSD